MFISLSLGMFLSNLEVFHKITANLAYTPLKDHCATMSILSEKIQSGSELVEQNNGGRLWNQSTFSYSDSCREHGSSVFCVQFHCENLRRLARLGESRILCYTTRSSRENSVTGDRQGHSSRKCDVCQVTCKVNLVVRAPCSIVAICQQQWLRV